MEKLTDNLKKVILAGIGAVATTAEKSKDVLDDMVKKGELTVEQGKVLNEELKHNLKQTVKNNVNVKVKVTTPEELSELLDKMTPEQLEALKAQIKAKESTVDSEAEEVNAEDTVEDVENAVFNMEQKEVSSAVIGELVMDRLKKLDQVAYVRFASVYREFKDVNTFMEELAKLLK